MVYVRFDDLRPGLNRSFGLEGLRSTLVAGRVDEVVEVLTRAEEEVRAGRWVAGWVSYEAAPAFASSLQVKDISGSQFHELPLAWFGVFDDRVPVEDEPRQPYDIGQWVATIGASDHRRGVEAIRRRIEAGDTYQANFTFRMQADFAGDAASFYRDLIGSQRGGYGAFLDAGRWKVLSASPELFFEWSDDRLVSKPMKGTASRGRDGTEDRESSDRLRSSVKEQAENVMIVDMVRNDLGRIARAGSVQVPALFETEKYDTVWQLTSTVTADATPGAGLPDVFAVLFPAASITGAPKVSTMGIIAGLESDPRGVYCGAIGFGGPQKDGSPAWAFNVGIRTVVIDGDRETAWYGTGGGITYDSEPAGEYAEALLKARVLGRRSSDFALIETMRWSPSGGFHLLDRHLSRLLASADYFDVPLDEHDVRLALRDAVDGHDYKSRVRLRVERDGTIEVTASSAPITPDDAVRVAVDDVPVDPADTFLRHKTSRRQIYEEAAARHPTAADVILVNDRGEATETTIANLVVEIGGHWLTPPVESGCLPGVERQSLIDEGRVIEKVVYVDDLANATSLGRVNSLRGWEQLALIGSKG